VAKCLSKLLIKKLVNMYSVYIYILYVVLLTNRFISGPFAEMPETPTHLSMLSDSIMRTPALNELSDNTDSESSESDNNSPEGAEKGVPHRTTFEPQLDLQRYRQLITHESADDKSYKVDNIRNEHSRNQKLIVTDMDSQGAKALSTSTNQSMTAQYSSQISGDGSLVSNSGNATNMSNAQNVTRNDTCKLLVISFI
jgi:hypothetical protein